MIVEKTLEDGRHIEYFESFWTGRRKLSIDGKELEKVGRRIFRDNENGSMVEYTAKGSFLTGVTLISDKGENYVLAKNKWYDWVMIFLPLLGIFFAVFCGAVGGGLGALFCVLGAVINAFIARSSLPVPVKIILQIVVALAVNAIWFALYFVVAVFILAIAVI